MKSLTAALLLVLAMASHSSAGHLASSLGYTASVPDNWVILTREEVRKNPDLFEDIALQGVSTELMENVRQMITGGKVDLLLRKGGRGDKFTDNINVFKQIQTLPSSEKDLKELCAMLPKELAEAFGRNISVHECAFRQVNGAHAVYLVFDGAVPGTRSMQLQIPRSGSVALLITATSKEATAREVEKELLQIVASLKSSD